MKRTLALFLTCILITGFFPATAPHTAAAGGELRGWHFVDAVNDITLSGQAALDMMGISAEEFIQVFEQEETAPVLPDGQMMFFSPPNPHLDMTVYDIHNFADRNVWAMEGGAAKVTSAYAAAEYAMYLIMSGTGYRMSPYPDWGGVYLISISPAGDVPYGRTDEIFRQIADFVYAYFPHHFHLGSTSGSKNGGAHLDRLNILMAHSFGVNHKEWKAEYDEAALLLTRNVGTVLNGSNGATSASIIDSGSDAEKLRKAHDYLARSVAYSMSAPRNQEAWSALVGKSSVCNGYALAYSMLCLRMGLDVPYMNGDAGGPHAWNLNLTGSPPGGTRLIDVTWARFNNTERIVLDFYDRPLNEFRAGQKDARTWSPYYESYLEYVRGNKYNLADGMVFDAAAYSVIEDDGLAISLTEGWLTWDVIKGANDLENNVRYNLTLPTVSPYGGAAISWRSLDHDIIDPVTGVVSRPPYNHGTPFETVQMTGTITRGDGDPVDRTFNLEVVRELPPDEAVAAGISWLTWNVIRGSNSQQNTVTDNLSLPKGGPEGTSVSWESSDPDMIDPDTGAVTRPASGTGDAEVTLTAAVSKKDTVSEEDVSDEKTFTVTVKDMSFTPAGGSSVNGTVGIGAGGANHINLTDETISTGISVAAWSIDNGKKWKKGGLPEGKRLTAMFNKGMTLAVADVWIDKVSKEEKKEGLKKGVPQNANIVKFPKIDRRPKANAEKLKPLYGASTWLPMKGTSVPGLSYLYAATSNGKTPEGSWMPLDFNGAGFTILEPGQKSAVLLRIAPNINGSKITPASGNLRVRPKSLAKAPKVKANEKKGIVKIKKGFFYQAQGGEPIATGSADVELTIVTAASGQRQVTGNTTLRIWRAATGKNPPSAVQELSLPDAPPPPES
jgi:hypothetical protein